MAKTTDGGAKGFLFRDLPQNILIGTASDRYAGWIGQIYSKGRYENGITRRSHKVGDKNFTEETLPVESVAEYFEHFPILEIDYTFYRPLLESKGSPSPNFHVLKSYRQQMKKGDLVLLKAPQIVIARKLRRGGAFVENEDYLNADIFTKQFYQPAMEILGPCLLGSSSSRNITSKMTGSQFPNSPRIWMNSSPRSQRINGTISSFVPRLIGLPLSLMS